MSSSPPSRVWATLNNFTVQCSKGGVAFRGADVARLLQHLLGEDEGESGVSLQSLRSELSLFLDSTSQTMSITALPAVAVAPVFDHVETPPVRRVARARRRLFWQLFHCWNSGAEVLSGSEKYTNLSHARPRGRTSRNGDDSDERSTSKRPQASTVLEG